MVKYYSVVEKQIPVDGEEWRHPLLLEKNQSSPCKRKLIIALYSVSLTSVLYMCYAYELYLFQLQQGSVQQYSLKPVPAEISNNLIWNISSEINFQFPAKTTAGDIPYGERF